MNELQIVEEALPLFELLSALHHTRNPGNARVFGPWASKGGRAINSIDIIKYLVVILFIVHV